MKRETWVRIESVDELRPWLFVKVECECGRPHQFFLVRQEGRYTGFTWRMAWIENAPLWTTLGGPHDADVTGCVPVSAIREGRLFRLADDQLRDDKPETTRKPHQSDIVLRMKVDARGNVTVTEK